MNWNHCERGTQWEFNLTQVALHDSSREDEKEKEGWKGEEQVVPGFFFFLFCLLRIVFEHI